MLSQFGGTLPTWLRMTNRKDNEWLQDAKERQRNVVFPDSVRNETRFWRNLGKQPFTTNTKIGLAVLTCMGWGFLAKILVASFHEGVLWALVLGFILLWGPIFGVIAWSARRSLRNLENARRRPPHNRNR